MDLEPLDRRVADIRRFNRFYTQRIGVLREGFLGSPFSLTEVRVLYELAHHAGGSSASELARELAIDEGYLSRILARFKKKGFVRSRPSEDDRRRAILTLTASGRRAQAELDARQREVVETLVKSLGEPEQRALLAAMRSIQRILQPDDAAPAPLVLRPHRPGDMGWIVSRHGALYSEEYGWGEAFEAMIAQIASDILRHHDPRRERCWIAELGGERVGSAVVVQESERVARLRLLFVEPHARRQGVGRRLVLESMEHARAQGFERLVVWTQDVLLPARKMYEAMRFRLVDREEHSMFGKPLTGETWEVDLR